MNQRKPWNEREEGRMQRQTLGQDGFSVSLPGAAVQQPVQGYACAPQAYAAVACRSLEFEQNADGTLTVVRCLNPNADDLDILYEAGNVPVAAIAARAFEGCTALRRVTLPATVRQIGEMAFSGCIRLQQVVIPGSVIRVGTLAFAKCTALSHVRLEPGVQTLGPSCFSKCTHLARVDMPASVTAIGGGAFFGCGRQLTLYGAEGAPAQRYAALNGLTYDTESWRTDAELILEENEDGTLTAAGARQSAPVRLEIPTEICGRRIAAIAPKAFFACTSLEQVSIGAGVRVIGESAFFGCRALVSVIFERGLEHIGDNAFASCESLTQAMLPWGTLSVGYMAFFGCRQLAFVKMPATTRVSDLAFEACSDNLRVYGGVNAGRLMPVRA